MLIQGWNYVPAAALVVEPRHNYQYIRGLYPVNHSVCHILTSLLDASLGINPITAPPRRRR